MGPFVVLTRLPKTGGYSIMSMLKRHPIRFEADEWCYPFKRRQYAKSPRWPFMIVSLREPRAHVQSQFMECAHDPAWGVKMTEHTRFPRSGKSDNENLIAWLRHFKDPTVSLLARKDKSHRQQPQDFNCYNPWNHEARHLTCGHGGQAGHHIHEEGGKPDLGLALQNLGTTNWVWITELFHESYCGAVYRITRSLPGDCDCREKEGQQIRTPHMAHGVPKHSVDQLPPQAISLIDEFTTVDRQIYVAAVKRLLHDIREVERETKTTIVCQTTLDEFQGKTGHLNELWGPGNGPSWSTPSRGKGWVAKEDPRIHRAMTNVQKRMKFR